MSNRSSKSFGARRNLVGWQYPELDGLRAVAVTAVVVYHCRVIAKPESSWQTLYFQIADMGWAGVDLFFVLSGFLITRILLYTKDDKHYFRQFYIRRALRIFPLYYLSIILIPVIFFVFDASGSIEVASFPYWFHLQNWLRLLELGVEEKLGHFWSLGVEEQFYLLWPALILFAAQRNIVHQTCLALLGATFAIRAVLVLSWQSVGAYSATISRLDGLVVGALLAFLLYRDGTLETRRLTAGWTIALIGGFIFLFAILGPGFNGLDPIVLLLGLLPVAFCFGSVLILALTTRPDGGLRLFLRSSPLRFVGKISFGVYVFHWPLVLLFRRIWPTDGTGFWVNQMSFLAIVLTTSLAVAWLSYRLFEKPILDLKDRLAPLSPATQDLPASNDGSARGNKVARDPPPADRSNAPGQDSTERTQLRQ